ncbi:hypothetical protein [Yersinia pekkanenii]|uniref:Phage-like protein n=1 Tax=Yersinia pekkanenii TaxID=1288385 RepID=A0A0T9QHJ9_9GAMM|nr:hypothetical protein [Yersinia pekkanenii]CNI12160.1 phage-like protein [Yersinia pekkanenii]CRY68398.1 phage-like protein [Yersinia pekkanenii]
MSNFVKIKSTEGFFILNTEMIESVFPSGTGSVINYPGDARARTSVALDVIAAALIPASDGAHIIDAVSIYPPNAVKGIPDGYIKEEPVGRAEPVPPIQEMKPITVNDAMFSDCVIARMITELEHHLVRKDIIELLKMVQGFMWSLADHSENAEPVKQPDIDKLEQGVRYSIARWISSRQRA